MKKKIFLITMFTLAGMLFSACSPVEPPANTDYIYGEEGEFEALDVILLESFPVQVHVQVYGYLADGCVELVEVSAERVGTSFVLSLRTRRPAGNIECTEALVPFETTVPLDVNGLPAGTYTVVAENQKTTFTLDVDNGSPDQNDEADFVFGLDALVDDLSVMILESFPVQVHVALTGNLPDGCTEINAITANREAQLFTVEVQTRRPAGDVVCTEALVPFEETVALDVLGLPAGEYTVAVQDLTETFELAVDNEPQEAPVDLPGSGGG